MCLIAFKPKGVLIPIEHLKNGFENNSDGWGIAYCDSQGIVKVRKNVSGFPQFISTYEHVVKTYPDSPVVVHFRWATHGSKSSAMCHPFYAANGTAAVAHNGILTAYSSPDKGECSSMSDTARFIERRLSPLILATEPEVLTTEAWGKLMGEEIGSYNKLCILTQGGGHVIVNHDRGEWFEGVWYSNGAYSYRTHRGMGFHEDMPLDRRTPRYSAKWERKEGLDNPSWDTDPTYEYWSKLNGVSPGKVRSADDEDDDEDELTITERRKRLREVEPAMVECDICGCHIKGKFYAGPAGGRSGDQVEFICESCVEEYLSA